MAWLIVCLAETGTPAQPQSRRDLNYLLWAQYGVQHGRSEVYNIGLANDIVDAMGSWAYDDARCHNAPHLWALGWAQPAGQLSVPDLGYSVQVCVSVGRVPLCCWRGFVPQAPTHKPDNTQVLNVPMQTRGPTGVQLQLTESNSFVVSYRGQFFPYDRCVLS